jgi:hypothetical protein
MSHSDARYPAATSFAARAAASCTAIVCLLLLGPEVAAERPRTVLVLAGPGESERVDELEHALTAHLIDSGAEPRIATLARSPKCPPEPGDTSHEQHLAGDVISLVWLSENGNQICTFTPEIDDRVNARELPDTGEGWASRSDVAASMVYSEIEPLVRREGDSGRAASGEPSRFAVAPRIGFDVPTSDLTPFLVAALELDLFLPVWNRRVALALDLSFTRPSHSGSGSDPRIGGDYRYEVHVLELKAALDIVFRLADKGSTAIPFLGVGAVCQYLLTEQTTTIAAGENTEWSFEPGFEVIAGLDVALGPGYLVFDIRYVFTELDHRFTGDTNAGNATTAVGYRLVF